MNYEQDRVGRCDFLDVLEEAAVLKRPVQVKTRDGQTFEDVVVDVPTESGRDWVVFAREGRFAVDDLESATRAVR